MYLLFLLTLFRTLPTHFILLMVFVFVVVVVVFPISCV